MGQTLLLSLVVDSTWLESSTNFRMSKSNGFYVPNYFGCYSSTTILNLTRGVLFSSLVPLVLIGNWVPSPPTPSLVPQLSTTIWILWVSINNSVSWVPIGSLILRLPTDFLVFFPRHSLVLVATLIQLMTSCTLLGDSTIISSKFSKVSIMFWLLELYCKTKIWWGVVINASLPPLVVASSLQEATSEIL
jgi:hypothetical protein